MILEYGFTLLTDEKLLSAVFTGYNLKNILITCGTYPIILSVFLRTHIDLLFSSGYPGIWIS